MIKKWKTLKDSVEFNGKIFRYRSVERASTTSPMQSHFDVLDFLDWVNIVALTKDQKIIVVTQYRQGIDDVTVEIPGGAIHLGEDPLLAAKRELREETGHESTSWQYLGVHHPNPAIQSNRCHVYLAKNCIEVGELQLDPLEELEVSKMSIADFDDHIKNGKISHSLVIVARHLAQNYF